jgi:hypothetical protein
VAGVVARNNISEIVHISPQHFACFSIYKKQKFAADWEHSWQSLLKISKRGKTGSIAQAFILLR